MDERTFGELVSNLSTFFERKPPSQATFRQWTQEVCDISNRIASWLESEVKKLEAFPRNLPAYLRSRSMEFKETNGENNLYKIHDRRFNPHRYAKSDCKKCAGRGLFDFHMDWPMSKDESGKVITRHVVRKALCPCTDAAEYVF